jgi:ComF family protein
LAFAAPQLQGLARAASRVLDILFPPSCLKCGAELEANGALCASCWPQIRFIAAPHCACCGLPFAYDVGAGAVCGPCVQDPPVFDRARAVFVYDDVSRDLVLTFKHADQTQAAPGYGKWLARAGAELLTDADLLVPVPLHRRRLFARRYNQAALLVHALATETAKENKCRAAPDALVRVKKTQPHIDMGRTARLQNVAGAFRVHSKWVEAVDGARIVLVDDVFTTGATVSSCARTLRAAGAARVDVLTLSRVVSGT